MIRKYGEMWQAWETADLFLVTGNACINAHGKLVMGRGSAAQARDRFKGVDVALGAVVAQEPVKRQTPTYNVHWPYYLLVSPGWQEGRKLGLFQTKEDWRDWSDLTIIDAAAAELETWVSRAREVLNRDPVVHMPFPGVGNGMLAEEQVLPHIRDLPDCVHVWQPEIFKPRNIDLPRDYEWVAQLSPGDVSHLDDIMGKGAQEAFEYIYESMADDLNGKLQQVLIVEAYLRSEKPKSKKRMGDAFHVGLNTYRVITGT